MNGEEALIEYFDSLLRAPQTESAAKQPELAKELTVRPFCLGKLRFAVPAEQLAQVCAVEGEITPCPGQPRWALGRVRLAGRELWAASLAKLLLPAADSSPCRWALVPRRIELALLCREVEAACRWQREQIRWRSERVSRPWLLGMLADPPCPLIDLERLVEDLKP
jgi:purine-binding chemotaxis protein CheW